MSDFSFAMSSHGYKYYFQPKEFGIQLILPLKNQDENFADFKRESTQFFYSFTVSQFRKF